MKYNPDIIKSDRKSISIEVRPDGKITLRVPKRMTYREIEKFVNEKSAWIEKTLAKCRPAENNDIVPFTDEEIEEMTKKAREIIPGRVEYYSKARAPDAATTIRTAMILPKYLIIKPSFWSQYANIVQKESTISFHRDGILRC